MFIEIQRGRSFRGLIQYCTHDVESETDHRVDFVETRNLATADPEIASQIMVSRWYLRDELKAEAGVGRGGRKDGSPVGHMVISWGKDEAESQQLDRKGMMEAVDGALQAIEAQDHHTLVISHKDTENPHCHVIIDLVQEDGRLKPSSHEGRKLSRFALEHEKKVHGHAIIATREDNIKALEAGQKPQRSKKTARSTFELQKIAQQDSHPRHKLASMINDRQKTIEQSKAALKDRQKRHAEELHRLHRIRLERNKAEHQSRLKNQLTEVDGHAASKLSKLTSQNFNDRTQFNHNEKSIRGVLRNAFEASRQAEALTPSTSRAGQLSRLFGFLTREADRRATLSDHQEEAEKRMKKELDRKQREVKREERKTLARLQREERAAYLKKSQRMTERQQASRERIAEQQKVNTRRRNALLQREREQQLKEKQRRSQQTESRPNTSPVEEPQRRRTRQSRQPRDPAVSRRKRTQELQEGFKDAGSPATGPPANDFEERMKARFRDQDRDFDLER